MSTAFPPAPAAVLEAVSRLNVSRESWQRVEQFVSLLVQWQARINLISPASLPHVWERHVLDSLQLLPLVPPGTPTVADLGSGSGFPALPLAICSGMTFYLFESNQKKAAFLREALRMTGAKGHIHPVRLTGDSPGAEFKKGEGALKLPKVELVTARALAPLSQLLVWAEPFLKNGAQALFHKGQDVDAELTEAKKYWKIQYAKHPSLTDPQGIILAVQEVSRV